MFFFQQKQGPPTPIGQASKGSPKNSFTKPQPLPTNTYSSNTHVNNFTPSTFHNNIISQKVHLLPTPASFLNGGFPSTYSLALVHLPVLQGHSFEAFANENFTFGRLNFEPSARGEGGSVDGLGLGGGGFLWLFCYGKKQQKKVLVSR